MRAAGEGAAAAALGVLEPSVATEAKKKKDKKGKKKAGAAATTHTPQEQGPTSNSDDGKKALSEVGTRSLWCLRVGRVREEQMYWLI